MEKVIVKVDLENEIDVKVIWLVKCNGIRVVYGVGNFYCKVKDMDSVLKVYEMGIEYNLEYYSNYVGKV